MGDVDAAKMIMVGTILGNYQKKINTLKNITPQEFSKMKQEFKKTYENLQLETDPNSPLGSLYSIFSDPTFLEGLKNCNNSMDLIDNFPLSGVQLKINKSLEINNVWDIGIQEVFDLQTRTDQTAVVKNNGAIIIEEGEKKFSVNCFLPLLD